MTSGQRVTLGYKSVERSPFHGGGDKPMPPASGETKQAYPIDLTLGIAIDANNFIVPSFTKVAHQDREVRIVADGSLDIRIPYDKGLCRFTITLDSHQWIFDNVGHDVMTFAEDVPDDVVTKYYPRYKQMSPMSFQFDALPIDVGGDKTIPALHHSFNLYVKLLQPNGATPLALRIDPDIINPGNHPLEYSWKNE